MLMTKLEVWEMDSLFRKWMIERVTYRYYREFFNDFKGKNILEIGCGHGFGAKTIKKYFSPNKIIAIDLDPRMVVSARKQIHDPTIVFEIADATKLPYKDNSFEAVFVYGVIHHIPGPLWKKSLDEINRILKKNGQAFIYDNSIESFKTLWGRVSRIISKHPYDSMYKKSEFINYLKSIGFKIQKDNTLGRYFLVITEK